MERIIITFNPDKSFRGASITDFDGLPVALNVEQLAAVAPKINAAGIIAITQNEQLLALKADMESKVLAALQSGDPAQFAAIGTEFVTPEQERIRAEKLAQLEALKTELGIP